MFEEYRQYMESNREERLFVEGAASYVELSYAQQLTLAVDTSAFLKFIDQRIMEHLGIYGFNRDIQETSK